jgi:hypothetical protein
MRRKFRFFFPLFVLCFWVTSHAQNWSGILDPKRAIDWSQAGAGTIPARTTICTTLNPGATAAQINTAIANCPANQTVFLSAGTYNLSGGLTVYNKSNVTLRGAGSNQTFLVFSSGGNGGVIYISNPDVQYSDDPHNVATWTGGYAPGAKSITLGSVSKGSVGNLKVGSLLILDQNDDASDPGDIYVCQSSGSNGTCSQEGSSHNGRPGRSQNQQVIVTSISGTGPWTIGITPGLYAPNWRSGQSPGAWWSSAPPVTGVGFEDFSVDVQAVSNVNSGIFYFQNVAYSWIKGIRSINSTGTHALHKHVWLYQSSHMTVRDSYFYGAGGASESYGVDTAYSSSDNLIENNIFQHIATATIREGDAGSVFGHNYAVDNFYNAGGGDWQQGDAYSHAMGDHGLWEGNIGSELELDDIHGTSFMYTAFRNYWTGMDTGGTKTSQTVPVQIYAGSRYVNLIGNVLGKVGYHTVYQTAAPSATDCGNMGKGNVSIYDIGYSSEMGTRYAPLGTCPNGLGANFLINNDTMAVASLMRWGNYDAVNLTARFVSSEVPSGLSPYGNPVPANQTLPNSFYLNAKPSWWGSVIPWPAIGPDVLGGIGPGGHVNLNPAAVCYLSVMIGKIDGSSGPLAFNRDTCYSADNGPQPPDGLKGVAH